MSITQRLARIKETLFSLWKQTKKPEGIKVLIAAKRTNEPSMCPGDCPQALVDNVCTTDCGADVPCEVDNSCPTDLFCPQDGGGSCPGLA